MTHTYTHAYTQLIIYDMLILYTIYTIHYITYMLTPYTCLYHTTLYIIFHVIYTAYQEDGSQAR